jgi:dihydrofolate reductase
MSTATAPSQPAEITLFTFMSLDGVTQAPGGPAEDTTGGFRLGGWVIPHFDEVLGGVVNEIFTKTGAFLLGRRTYDIFAGHWPHVTDPNDFVAKQLNTLPKFVASRSTSRFAWKGTTAIRNVVEEVTALKTQVSGELQVHGSGNLAQTLIEHDLIDEYRLAIFPVLLGSGRRLFNNNVVPSDMKLVDSRTTSTGVVYSTYRRGGKLKTGNVILNADGTYTMVS